VCYAVMWQHVTGTVCVPFAVLSERYTYHTYDMLPHHRIIYNDVVFTES